MAYDPRDPVVLAHGVDSFAVYTDSAWATTVAEASDGKENKDNAPSIPDNILSWTVTIPTYLGLTDPYSDIFREQAENALKSMGFSRLWARGIKTDKGRHGIVGMWNCCFPGAIHEILPDIASRAGGAMAPIFKNDRSNFLKYAEMLEDLPLSSKIMRMMERGRSEHSFKSMSDLGAMYMKLILTPLLYPFLTSYAKSDKDQDVKKNKGYDPWNILWSGGEERDVFLRDALNARYLSSNFFISRFAYATPQVNVYEPRVSQPGRMWATIPCPFWRGGAYEISRILKKIQTDNDLYVSLERGVKYKTTSSAPTDPYGMRGIYTLSLVVDSASSDNKKLKKLAGKLAYAFTSGRENTEVRTLMQVAEEDLQSKYFQPVRMEADPAAFVMPCDKENKWRHISPQIFIRLASLQAEPTKKEFDKNVDARNAIDRWAQDNGCSPRWYISKNGVNVGCYIANVANRDMDTLDGRVFIANDIIGVMRNANMPANLKEPVARISFWVTKLLQ